MTEVALYTFGAVLLFWHGYVHAMGLYRARLQGRLKGLPLVLALPVVSITFVLDVLLQFTVASLVFWRWPEQVGVKLQPVVKWGRVWSVPWPVGDWFVTHRLRRYIAGGEALGWRYRVAHLVCHYLADPFDPTGAHCDSDPPELRDGKT
jgi:hypothetical protein